MARTQDKIDLTNITIRIETEMREPITSERAKLIAKLITERAELVIRMRKAKRDRLAEHLYNMEQDVIVNRLIVEAIYGPGT